jgi:hypothetical protein
MASYMKMWEVELQRIERERPTDEDALSLVHRVRELSRMYMGLVESRLGDLRTLSRMYEEVGAMERSAVYGELADAYQLEIDDEK